jgi:hypothetical protein
MCPRVFDDLSKDDLDLAYGAACLASVNVSIPATEIALTLPPGWNGPFAVEFGPAVTVVTVGSGALLALAGLYLVSSM